MKQFGAASRPLRVFREPNGRNATTGGEHVVGLSLRGAVARRVRFARVFLTTR